MSTAIQQTREDLRKARRLRRQRRWTPRRIMIQRGQRRRRKEKTRYELMLIAKREVEK